MLGHEARVEDLDRRAVAGDDERDDEVERQGPADEHAVVGERDAGALPPPQAQGQDRRQRDADDRVGEVAAEGGGRVQRGGATVLDPPRDTVVPRVDARLERMGEEPPHRHHAERQQGPGDGEGLRLRACRGPFHTVFHIAKRPITDSSAAQQQRRVAEVEVVQWRNAAQKPPRRQLATGLPRAGCGPGFDTGRGSCDRTSSFLDQRRAGLTARRTSPTVHRGATATDRPARVRPSPEPCERCHGDRGHTDVAASHCARGPSRDYRGIRPGRAPRSGL